MERYLEMSKENKHRMGQYGHLMELQLSEANKNADSIKADATLCIQDKREHSYWSISQVCSEYDLLAIKSLEHQILSLADKRSVLITLHNLQNQQKTNPKPCLRKKERRN